SPSMRTSGTWPARRWISDAPRWCASLRSASKVIALLTVQDGCPKAGRPAENNPGVISPERAEITPGVFSECRLADVGRDFDREQPAVAVRHNAIYVIEVRLLHGGRDRAPAADADWDLVDRPDGRDFRRGAAEEHFVRDVQHLARQVV